MPGMKTNKNIKRKAVITCINLKNGTKHNSHIVLLSSVAFSDADEWSIDY